ncbi:MAG: hypothetical protein NC203_06260 [Firmicutes bacterium]|nr:hypothetical protein [Bacillota bacterium]
MIYGIGSSRRCSSDYLSKAVNYTSKIPAVPQMLTQGQCSLNDKQLAEKIAKMAQSDAAAGKDSQFGGTVKGAMAGVGTAEWKKLRDDFVSLASPDRMGLVKNRLSELGGQMNLMQLQIKDRFEFFNVLFANNKKFGPDVGGNFIKFRDEQGNEIADYSTPNGWNTTLTPAERTRMHLFDDLWKQALADAKEELELNEKQAKAEQEQASQIPDREIEMSFLI